ncbi:MAG TPA: EAL domain-containing protein [Candidatus Limnocylindrales bacterium]
MEEARPARRMRWPAVLRVWAFSLSLAVGATLLFLGDVRFLPRIHTPFDIPWPVIAGIFYLAEVKVVEVHFRRETHSFSLSEVPAVIGLFFLGPLEYMLALLLGSGVALAVHSRQSPLKLTFNLSYYALAGVVSLALFHALGRFGSPPGPGDWAATFAATLTTCVLGAVSIATVISLSGGAPQYRKLPEMLQFGGMGALANTSLALLGVSILWSDPLAIWLLAVPILTLFIAYRAYVSEREKGERLELLYESSRILQRSPELDSALIALLEHAREMFRAERAEVILYPRDGTGDALRTSCGADLPTVVMTPVAIDPDDRVRRQVTEDGHAVFHVPTGGRDAEGIRQAMVSPLVGESGVIGTMTIANRLTEGTSFGEDDLRLLETLANQAAVALENGQLEQSLAELSRLKEQLRHQAYHDSLTSLANRALFTEQVETRLAAHESGVTPVVLFLDLDDFKVVNDTLGHGTGDLLLVAVAERIAGAVRADDLAARLGGDEFAILISDRSGLEEAITLAGRLLDALAAPFLIRGHEILVGTSIGIAAARLAGEHSDELLRNADVAMYTAKASGKRRFAVFEPTMHAALVARHELSAELSRSVARRELEVFYQPIIDLATLRISGVEALIRWRHPVRGLVVPDEFIRLAEETGAIIAVGRWVLHAASTQVVAWHRRFGFPLSLSVNLSPHELQQVGFIAEVAAILDETGLQPRDLILEMTETAMFQDTQTSIAKLDSLRRQGVRIAVDDFGTGYSSLGYLRRFPVDILKIARDFVGQRDAATPDSSTAAAGRTESTADEDWAFAHAIVALGQKLGLTIVAEGIETSGQLQALRELGCELGQGFLFLPPVDGNTFEEFLTTALAPSAGGAEVAAASRPPLPEGSAVLGA